MSEPLYPAPLALDPGWTADTVAVQAGRPPREPGAPMNLPVSMSSTYVHDAALEYGRDGSAAYGALEAALGALDGGRAITFATGLAAATAIADLVPAGGTVVLSTLTYYGVRTIFQPARGGGSAHCPPGACRRRRRVRSPRPTARTWSGWSRSPTRCSSSRTCPPSPPGPGQHGALTVVDATFATPLRQRPLDLGADIVMHSATKFIGGHSDLLLGAAICRDDAHAAALAAFRHDHGSIPGALESYLALRGLRTLSVRLDRAEASAVELARRLTGHPLVSAVHYPGLPGDSEHERAARVLPHGCGPMLSFEVAGTVEQTDAFLARLRLFAHATSLGGVESLIERRARYAGDADVVGPTLCRASVGLENVEDLWTDLETALRASIA